MCSSGEHSWESKAGVGHSSTSCPAHPRPPKPLGFLRARAVFTWCGLTAAVRSCPLLCPCPEGLQLTPGGREDPRRICLDRCGHFPCYCFFCSSCRHSSLALICRSLPSSTDHQPSPSCTGSGAGAGAGRSPWPRPRTGLCQPPSRSEANSLATWPEESMNGSSLTRHLMPLVRAVRERSPDSAFPPSSAVPDSLMGQKGAGLRGVQGGEMRALGCGPGTGAGLGQEPRVTRPPPGCPPRHRGRCGPPRP